MSKHFSAVTVFCLVCLAVVMTACGGMARLIAKLIFHTGETSCPKSQLPLPPRCMPSP